MSTTIIGFPRLGEFRELKFLQLKNTLEKEISADELWQLPKTCVLNTEHCQRARYLRDSFK